MERVDDLTWLVRLRPGVRFQNGRALDAPAVVRCFRRQLEHRPGVAEAVPELVVEAVGDLEVRLRTANPTPLLAHSLADLLLFPVYDAEALEGAPDPGAGVAGLGAFTGPYAVVGLDEERLVLERFEGYWAGTPPLERIEFRFVSEPQARLAAVVNGEADIAETMHSPEIAREVKGRDDVVLRNSEVPVNANRLYFNVADAPLDDVRVRRAVALALDHEAIARDFLEGTQEPAAGLLPKAFPHALDTNRTDVAEAARLLDEAGWRRDGDAIRTRGGQPLVVRHLIYPEQPHFELISVVMQDQLARVGIKLEITSQPYDDTMYADASRWDTALYSDYSLSSTAAPDTYLQTYLGTGGFQNFGGVSDPALDRLLARLAQASDEATRGDLLTRVQRLVAERAYLLNVTFGHETSVVSPKWRSYRPSEDSFAIVSVTFNTQPG